MRILLYDPGQADYHVGSVLERPLGGTQSAACYLAMELARAGHEVIYLTGAAGARTVEGVACLGRAYLRYSMLPQLDPDVLVILQRAGSAAGLRSHLPARTRLVLWTADTPGQSVLAGLKDEAEQGALDAVVAVSQWHREQLAAAFPGVSAKVTVLGYGIAPAFYDLYPPHPPAGAILPDKCWPPVLAYTSTPFRGLAALLGIFPEIRRRVPGTRLRVYAGMRVYFIEPLADSREMRALYEACRGMEGVEYIGNVAQPELARGMREVSMLCYPNTYEETACIAVMEAMAAGCSILTSALGALPETCGGHARLIEPTAADAGARFVEAAVEMLERQRGDAAGEERRRREAVDHARAAWHWPERAKAWEAFLGRLTGG